MKRIEPGLVRGSIPLLARSIAREIADATTAATRTKEAIDIEADLHAPAGP